MTLSLALLGYGEAGRTFARAGDWGMGVRVFDVKQLTELYGDDGVAGCLTSQAAIAGTPLIISLVTADQALIAAQDASLHIVAGALYLDLNSVAPDTKCAAAAAIEAAGGHYVDVAVMAPVHPERLAIPLLISGPQSEAAQAALADLGFSQMRIVGATVGRAAIIKMLRSIMYKGLEALTAECALACQQADVLEEVAQSLGSGWADEANYRMERMMTHGLRRAAEMEEVVKTLEGLGIAPMMTKGIVERQREIGARALSPAPTALNAKLKALLFDG
jgi:3-hydroxyisobutyrate dehydrogenase-like beta-hydroxyacid dehydrogenase